MGNVAFDNAAINLAQIHAIFKRTIGNQLEEDAVHSDFKGYKAIDTSNRYFTPRDGKRDLESVSLGNDVDPHGFLFKAAGNAYVHTEDNKVYYYQKGVNKGGETL
jgi:hypothetical protein